MTEQQPSSDNPAARWEAAIVYPDGRAPTVLTPPDGVLHAEAQAIAATYAETAESEGGEVTTASLRSYPTDPMDPPPPWLAEGEKWLEQHADMCRHPSKSMP